MRASFFKKLTVAVLGVAVSIFVIIMAILMIKDGTRYVRNYRKKVLIDGRK